MNARAWQAAQTARTLSEAHTALVALRPLPEAARSVWVSYFARSSAVYRLVAEVDRGHYGHAVYWADREKAKADLLTSTSTETTGRRQARRGKASDIPVAPSTLEDAHEALSKLCPSSDAAQVAWLTFHQRAAAVYAEVAEVDRAHHHEALFFAGLERRTAEALSARTGVGVDTGSSVDSACQ